MAVNLSKNVVNGYIENYYKELYPVNLEIIPNFWELLVQCILDENSKIVVEKNNETYIFITKEKMSIGYGEYYENVSFYSYTKYANVNSVEEFIYWLAEKIKKDIVESEEKVHGDDIGLKLFLLENRIKKLETEMENVRGNLRLFC